MAEEFLGLRKEPLFGRKERLYAAPQGDFEIDPPAPNSEHEQHEPRRRPLTISNKNAPVATVNTETQEEETSLAIRDWVSTSFELLGIASMTVGGFLLAPWVGWMILGGLLIVLGVATGYGA